MNFRHIFATLALGVFSGLLAFLIINELEEIRGFSTLLITIMLVSLTLSIAYHQLAGRLKDLRVFIPSSLTIFAVALLTFTLYLGFAVMSEYTAYLFVEKTENATGCIELTENQISKLPFLREALEKARAKEKAIIEIHADDVENLGGIYGKCVIYRGEKYTINLAVP